jgi:IS30 family transposase
MMERKPNQRLSQKDKLTIKELTNKGKSLRNISKIMNLGITTIYYQVRKFKPKRKKDFIVNLSEEKIGELIGAFAGDGSYYYSINSKGDIKRGGQYKIRYHLSLKDDRPYAEYLKNLLIKLNLNPHLIIGKNNTINVSISSISYINFIKQYLKWDEDKTLSIRLRNNLNNYSNEFLRGFARGLMDTDGFLNTGNAICACISKKLIDNLSAIFTKFGLSITRTINIRGGNRRPLYYVRVRRESLRKYHNFISFSNEYKHKAIIRILGKDLKEH